jgi:hypothetical protein
VVVVVDVELETEPGVDDDPLVVVVELPLSPPFDDPVGVFPAPDVPDRPDTTFVPMFSVWNPRTAASPAAVAATTMGVRFIA